jgi:hypothetical protein
MRLLKLFALLATLTGAAAAAAQADDSPPWGPETPHFNLQVVLRPTADGPEKGFGLVKFRQPNDVPPSKVILLDTWLRDLAPNHRYNLQRAVDLSSADGVCGSESGWQTLGEIRTDDRGTGRAALSRDVTTVPIREFDINFRVIDAETSALAVVLQSGCYQYTVEPD